MTYEVDLKATIKVQFSDPVKAKYVFLESDWKDCFFDYRDMTEVAEHVAWMFQTRGTDCIEGFGAFKREKDYYVSSDETFGSIYIQTVNELDAEYTDEDAVGIVEV